MNLTIRESRRRRRGSIAAVVGLLLLAGSVIVTGGPPAAAQGDLTVLEGTMDVGELISFEWEGEADIEGGTLEADGWDAVGGWFPDVDVTADVDAIVGGTHVVLSSYEIAVVGTSCVVTIPGPLLVDHTTGTTYYAHFDAVDLGTVAYSGGCGSGPSSIRNLFETAFTTDGLLLQFEVDHVEPEPLYVTAGQASLGAMNWSTDEPVIVDEDHLGPMLWLIVGGDPSMPFVEMLSHVDSFIAGDSLELLLVEVTFPGYSDCVMTWHGPLELVHVGSSQYANAFSKAQLGGVLYANCAVFEQAYWLAFLASGVTILLEIGHL